MQGSVAYRLDSGNNVLSKDLYDAWGTPLSSGSSTDPVGFGGRFGYYTDHENGLLLLTNRFYDPARGRFLNLDPIGYAGGMNLYAYVGDNPMNGADPSGLQEVATPEGITILGWDEIDIKWPIVNRFDLFRKQKFTLYHSTSKYGLNAIVTTGILNPSLGLPSSKTAYHGEGQYFTDYAPEDIAARRKCDIELIQRIEGKISLGQLSYTLFSKPWGYEGKMAYYLEFDVTDTHLIEVRDHIFVHPSISPLYIGGNIVRFGRTPYVNSKYQ